MLIMGLTQPRWYTRRTAVIRWFSAYEPTASLQTRGQRVKTDYARLAPRSFFCRRRNVNLNEKRYAEVVFALNVLTPL